MHIVYVSDGKAGHRAQALGLWQAMQRALSLEISFQEINIAEMAVFPLFVAAFRGQHSAVTIQPDYIFSVGSHTQLRALLLGRVYPQAKKVVLMKPNYPFACFDTVVVPKHDAVKQSNNVIETQGALNPIVNQHEHQAERILIALGGGSKRHQWHTDRVLTTVTQIIQANPNAKIIMTTSRRTPADVLRSLEATSDLKRLEIYPVEQTPQGWIFQQMQLAEAVWVTEDSVSMLFEALTAGCRVGLIQLERLKQDRITQSVDLLINEQWVSRAFSMKDLPQAQYINEADRVAHLLLSK
ncbi:mitochondrial fission ELM1 family protein [Acinetobacter rudis]|uniref:Nucleoside-diphosphate sugar epimerase n=1 Tax=Acinetobacter rudis CIP 110305 TaxID=421052 RepID=S3PLS3_9GAMM|nr:ELM1/GtrOC1 family putative glycosyltransferase [Acinetobacter rudis]EPF79771.1 hypothetical protein F945_00659 [Acinetobacter rudis CIP 110305]